jgi:hypothetical protein
MLLKYYSKCFIYSVEKLVKKIYYLLNSWTFLSLLIIIFCIYCLKYLINDKNNETINLKVECLFNDQLLKLNQIQLKDLSGEYQQISNREKIVSKNKYFIEDLYFLLTTNTKRIRYTIHFIKFWAKIKNIKCLIVFEENDLSNKIFIKQFLLRHEIKCQIETSTVKRYEERYFQLIQLIFNKTNLNQIKWFCIGDDDTIWFMNNLLKTLEQYNSSKLLYLGNVSDKNKSLNLHGSYYAYGGAGILLSQPLAFSFANNLNKCKQFMNINNGDEMIGSCLTQMLKINLTINKHFHQIDHQGDIYGFLQSGIDGLVTLHHVFSQWEPFPQEHSNDEKDILNILSISYYTHDFNFLKRFVKFNLNKNQTFLLTIGYSFTLFNRILTFDQLNQIEQTWCCEPFVHRTSRNKEINNINWFFKQLNNKNSNRISSIYQYNEKQRNIPNLEITII